jgi:hypothetical protein
MIARLWFRTRNVCLGGTPIMQTKSERTGRRSAIRLALLCYNSLPPNIFEEARCKPLASIVAIADGSAEATRGKMSRRGDRLSGNLPAVALAVSPS